MTLHRLMINPNPDFMTAADWTQATADIIKICQEAEQQIFYGQPKERSQSYLRLAPLHYVEDLDSHPPYLDLPGTFGQLRTHVTLVAHDLIAAGFGKRHAFIMAKSFEVDTYDNVDFDVVIQAAIVRLTEVATVTVLSDSVDYANGGRLAARVLGRDMPDPSNRGILFPYYAASPAASQIGTSR